MTCADDLTSDDLDTSVSTEVLERVSGGEGSTTNLWAFIDRDSVEGVNVLEPGSAPRVIKTWDERLSESQIESGVDDELILHVPFTTSLRLRTLILFPPAPSHPHRSARLRLYANLTYCPSFADLEDMDPVMDLNTETPPPGYRRGVDGEREVEEWGLKVQKLANVHSVTLLFSEATTGQRTALMYVGFKGDPKQLKMDMSRLGQVPAQNAADKQVDGVKEKQGGGYTTIK